MLLLQLLSDLVQTWQEYLAQILFLTETVGFELIVVSLVLMTSKHNASCFDKESHFSAVFQKFYFFDKDYEKVCYSLNIYQKENNL